MSQTTFPRRSLMCPIRSISKTSFLEWPLEQLQLNEFERCLEDKSTQSLNSKREGETQTMIFLDLLLTRFLSKHTCLPTPKVERVEEVFLNITQGLLIREIKVLMSIQSLTFKNRRSKTRFIIKPFDPCRSQMLTQTVME